MMISNDRWYEIDGKLYDRFFIWHGFYEILLRFFCWELYSILLLRNFYSNFIYFCLLINLAILIYFFHDLLFFLKKNNKSIGEPIVIITEDKISIHKKFSRDKKNSISFNLYKDDEIHLAGLNNFKFIRFINKKNGNREIKISHRESQYIIRFIFRYLSLKYSTYIDDSPSTILRIRGDF